ncbi:hypothetical protein N0V82_000759 [Gnomoniopsis sp. IMI 355080]|nr:hypothetical protein N0V82_000759 [Gnomoniopsis sp. IMI 355080]
MSTNLQNWELSLRSASLVSPTTAPSRRGVSINDLDSSISLEKNNNRDLIVTTVENGATCGWYSGAISQPFECSTSFSCATNTDSIIACSKKGDKSAFFSVCIDLVNAVPKDCSVPGVLCCNSINPSCMTLLWTASPTRSLVGCDSIHSTWVMLDYPFEGDEPTITSASDDPTSTLQSPQSASTSNTSQPTPTGDIYSSGSPSPSNLSDLSSISSSGGNTVTSAPALGFSTYPVATSASNSASPPSTTPAPSGGLSTGAEAGIGIGACIGLLTLVLIAVFFFFFFKKRQNGSAVQPEEQPQNSTGTGGPLQDNPSGELPASIAPPARLARSLSTGWIGDNGNNDEYDMLEGASEVPVDMRGQGVGAVELPGSPVEMMTRPLGVAQNQYNEYQTQASQYRRYSQITRDPRGPVSYRGPPCE